MQLWDALTRAEALIARYPKSSNKDIFKISQQEITSFLISNEHLYKTDQHSFLLKCCKTGCTSFLNKVSEPLCHMYTTIYRMESGLTAWKRKGLCNVSSPTVRNWPPADADVCVVPSKTWHNAFGMFELGEDFPISENTVKLPILSCRSCRYQVILLFTRNSEIGQTVPATKNYAQRFPHLGYSAEGLVCFMLRSRSATRFLPYIQENEGHSRESCN